MSRRSLRSLGRFAPKLNCEQLESRLLFAAADLSDWMGSNNTVSPNNYTTSGLPAITAGGTFQSRRGATAASLSDPTIGTALGYNTSFSMSGSITFNAPTTPQVDPIWFLGFYNNTTNTHRVGLSAANASPAAGDVLRFQIQSTNSAGTGVANADLANGGNKNITDGTYSFSVTYNGTTHSISASIGSFTASATYAYTGTADLNRFGFLQAANTADTNTFTASITNINYTGETQVSSLQPPANFAAAPGNGQVTLSWTDASGETGYTVKHATNPSFTGATTTTYAANSTSAVIGSLTNGTTYYFRIKSTNGGTSSAWSPTANATPAAQDNIIKQHGNAGYSSTYAASWTGLQTGKQQIQARPPTTVTHYNVKDGIIDGNNDGDYVDAGVDVTKKDLPTSVDVPNDIAYLEDVNYDLTWTSTSTIQYDAPTAGKMWHFEDYNKVIVDNVTISQTDTNSVGVATMSFYNIGTVEIRNCKFVGEVRSAHMLFQNVKNIFIDGVEVKGDASGRGGGAISVQNGDANHSPAIPLGTLEWLVVQNSWFHDVWAIKGTTGNTDRDAFQCTTFADGVLFNNTIENWKESAGGDIDAAVDISIRTPHPLAKTVTFRLERNEFLRNTAVKNVGNPVGDSNVRHNTIWTNNLFLDTGIHDYHSDYTANWVNNTWVLDPAKKGTVLVNVSNFFQWFAYPGAQLTNMYNNVISQVGATAINALYHDKAPSEYPNLGANNNWIGIPGTVPYLTQVGGATVSTAAAWQASPYLKDVNSKIGAVNNFVDYTNNNFHLTAQPSGYSPNTTYLATGSLPVGLRVYRDWDGETRGSNPTVGAYQV